MARRPAGDVEAEIDRLFELSPERFVAERDATAKRLRSGGDVEAAARVTKLRRPTVAAWALDQLARPKKSPRKAERSRKAVPPPA